MPFIHVPTWRVEKYSVELVLGVAALGAQYCFESRVSEQLFLAGKTIVMWRLGKDAELSQASTGPSSASIHTMMQNVDSAGDNEHVSPIDTIRALITLMGFATWEPKPPIVQESFALQSVLTQYTRAVLLDDVDWQGQIDQQGNGVSLGYNWQAWIEQESSRRSRLIAFSFLHTHRIAYNVYPALRSSEVNLRLPCSTKEWKAPTALLWQAAMKETQKPQLLFKEALSLLFKNRNDSAPIDPIPTPLGNYILLHGLLQRIHIVRSLARYCGLLAHNRQAEEQQFQ